MLNPRIAFYSPRLVLEYWINVEVAPLQWKNRLAAFKWMNAGPQTLQIYMSDGTYIDVFG